MSEIKEKTMELGVHIERIGKSYPEDEAINNLIESYLKLLNTVNRMSLETRLPENR